MNIDLHCNSSQDHSVFPKINVLRWWEYQNEHQGSDF